MAAVLASEALWHCAHNDTMQLVAIEQEKWPHFFGQLDPILKVDPSLSFKQPGSAAERREPQPAGSVDPPG